MVFFTLSLARGARLSKIHAANLPESLALSLHRKSRTLFIDGNYYSHIPEYADDSEFEGMPVFCYTRRDRVFNFIGEHVREASSPPSEQRWAQQAAKSLTTAVRASAISDLPMVDFAMSVARGGAVHEVSVQRHARNVSVDYGDLRRVILATPLPPPPPGRVEFVDDVRPIEYTFLFNDGCVY